jgi:uncharacterized repeat protein (TIGR01451 family)
MKKFKNNPRALTAALICLVAAATAAAGVARQQLAPRAQGLPEIKVMLSGSVARAGESVALDKAGAVHPGEILDWRITSANEGDGAARQYKTVGQIPHGTSFVAGSASAEYGAAVTYSIDGGKTFAAVPTVEEKQPDGTTKRVPAPASAYTQVRYEWSDPLAAGSTLAASYKVRVK